MQIVYILIGSFLGFLLAILGGILTENRQRKKELREAYSWVSSLLYRFLDKEQIKEVKDSLTAPALHYTFNKFWYLVPEKDNKLNVREAIFRFITGGDHLPELQDDSQIEELHRWLKKNFCG
jgi:hypothetical protein